VNYNLEEISVQELIGDVLDTFYMEIQNKHLKLDVNIEDKFISVDIDQMHRAVSNIISNGIRYAVSAIRVDFKDDQLSIWNDGTTLSDEDMKKVFERFYMGQGGSTGIGLSLAKEIIELHKFSVKAENYQGGVRFVIDMRK
jgi:signal transduction histidine kinase